MPLLNGKFYGGSCSTPVVKNADVYIGFDYSMKPRSGFPWEEDRPVDVYFPVVDRGVVDNPKDFIALVDWTVKQLDAGKTVHAGCIGGHGRTGTFLAALWKTATGYEDAITAVRTAYCHKAVESEKQVVFLSKYFGIKKVSGTDAHKSSSYSTGKTWTAAPAPKKSWGSELQAPPSKTVAFADAKQVHTPVKSLACIWGTAI